MPTTPKRTIYTAKFKLKVIQFAESNGNRAAGREYDVSEKLVRDWKRCKDMLEKIPKNKCADRGKNVMDR